MKVLTAYPIVINKKRISPADYYLNLDAKNKEEVKAFQRYAVSRGYNLDYISKSTGKLVSGEKAIDGIYGGKTSRAYDKIGADWEKTRTSTTPSTTTTTTTTDTTTTTPSGTTTEIKKDEVKVTTDANGNTVTETKKADGTVVTEVKDKAGNVIKKDEKKGMPKALKWGLIIGGGVLVLGVLIYALTSSSGSSTTPRRRRSGGKTISKTTTTTTVRRK
jgi:hypothetical protein